MVYDENLAQRIRSRLGERPSLSERKMFGGLCFMAGGNMFAGVVGDELMVRVGPGQHEELLSKPGARPMDFTGRPMKGMLYVGAPAIAAEDDLGFWLDQAYGFAGALPPKTAASKRKTGSRWANRSAR